MPSVLGTALLYSCQVNLSSHFVKKVFGNLEEECRRGQRQDIRRAKILTLEAYKQA